MIREQIELDAATLSLLSNNEQIVQWLLAIQEQLINQPRFILSAQLKAQVFPTPTPETFLVSKTACYQSNGNQWRRLHDGVSFTKGQAII